MPYSIYAKKHRYQHLFDNRGAHSLSIKNYASIISDWLVDLSQANTRTTTNNFPVERTAKRSSAAPLLKKTSPTSPMT